MPCNVVIEHRSGQHLRSLAADQHNIAFVDRARGGIVGVEANRFSPLHFRGRAVRAVVELAVQPRLRVVGDKTQWVLTGAEPGHFSRRKPRRMRRTVVVPEIVDGVRDDLDQAARGRQRVGDGVVAEVLIHHVTGHRAAKIKASLLPELREVFSGSVLVGSHGTPLLVHLLQPAEFVQILGELLVDTESFAQVGEDVVVVHRLTDGRGDLSHGNHRVVETPAADVVAFECGGHREHDVGVACGRRPERFVHDDGLGSPERASEAPEILVMVERVAAGPIDQAGVRVVHGRAVELVALAGVQQHVCDAGDRDELTHRVVALTKRGQVVREFGGAHPSRRAVTVPETSTGQPDLTEERGQCDGGPQGLFAE